MVRFFRRPYCVGLNKDTQPPAYVSRPRAREKRKKKRKNLVGWDPSLHMRGVGDVYILISALRSGIYCCHPWAISGEPTGVLGGYIQSCRIRS